MSEASPREATGTWSAGTSAEGTRLARTLTGLMPDKPEALGLLALMLLQNARSAPRVEDAGVLVPLDRGPGPGTMGPQRHQDGLGMLDAALRRGQPGPYQVQSAIATCHATAEEAAATDWVEVDSLYRELARMVPSPVVEPKRAGAVAMADRLEAGLRVIDAPGGVRCPARLPPAARDPRRPSRAPRRGGHRLPSGAGTGDGRRRAPIPRPPPAETTGTG